MPRKDITNKNVHELFKDYQNLIMSTAKPSDINYMKEVYSETELFDLTNIPNVCSLINYQIVNDEYIFNIKEHPNLPFKACFLKYNLMQSSGDTSTACIFLHEYAPFITTGAIYTTMVADNKLFEDSMSFNIQGEELHIKKLNLKQLNKEAEYTIIKTIGSFINDTINKINSLSSYTTLVDHTGRSDYFNFRDKQKQKRTVKVNRKIYYITEKKSYLQKSYNIRNIGNLEYSHAFKVRGHWRKHTGIGKDRTGKYVVKGYTWVVDYIKGKDKELIQKVRVIK